MKENLTQNLIIPYKRKRPFKITWTKEEDEILFATVIEAKKNSWKTISKKLNNKTPSQCFYRYHSKNTNLPRRNWTREEDHTISNFVKIKGKNWEELAGMLNSRSSKEVRERYLKRLDESLIRSKFSIDEDNKIVNLYLLHGSKWSFISKFFTGRTADMLKSRFYSSLQKSILKNIERVNNSGYLSMVNNVFFFIIFFLN